MPNLAGLWDPTLSDIARQNFLVLDDNIGVVTSRGNFAIAGRSVASNTSLSEKDSVVFGDTSVGSVTLTLPYANTWGASKSPLITIVKTSNSNTLTINAQSGDSIVSWATGAIVSASSVTSTGITVLASDGANTWYILAGVSSVSTPYYAHARLTSSMAGFSTETKITPLTTNLSGFTVSSDILTCTNGGYYRLDMIGSIYFASTSDVVYIGYRVNGGTTINVLKASGVFGTQTMPFLETAYVKLNASDTVEFRVQRASGSGADTLYVDTEFNLTQIA